MGFALIRDPARVRGATPFVVIIHWITLVEIPIGRENANANDCRRLSDDKGREGHCPVITRPLVSGNERFGAAASPPPPLPLTIDTRQIRLAF